MRISYTIPDEIARELEVNCISVGYPSSRAFLRAFTLWAAAKLAEPSPAMESEYAEEVRAMFSELSATSVPDYGNTPRRHRRPQLERI